MAVVEYDMPISWTSGSRPILLVASSMVSMESLMS